KKFEVENFNDLINDGEKYIQLSDSIIYEIEYSKDKKNINEKILDKVINCVENVDRKDVIVDWLSFDYCKKDKNPDVSYLLPKVYKEEIVQIYLRTKENDQKDELKIKVKEIKTAFRENAKILKLIKEEEEGSSSESEKDKK
ncbi:47_t:CDS:2, partial [Gigaspora rosea]